MYLGLTEEELAYFGPTLGRKVRFFVELEIGNLFLGWYTNTKHFFEKYYNTSPNF